EPEHVAEVEAADAVVELARLLVVAAGLDVIDLGHALLALGVGRAEVVAGDRLVRRAGLLAQRQALGLVAADAIAVHRDLAGRGAAARDVVLTGQQIGLDRLGRVPLAALGRVRLGALGRVGLGVLAVVVALAELEAGGALAVVASDRRRVWRLR